jgi:hypothetical protein
MKKKARFTTNSEATPRVLSLMPGFDFRLLNRKYVTMTDLRMTMVMPRTIYSIRFSAKPK